MNGLTALADRSLQGICETFWVRPVRFCMAMEARKTAQGSEAGQNRLRKLNHDTSEMPNLSVLG